MTLRHLGENLTVPAIGQGSGFDIKTQQEVDVLSRKLLKGVKLGLNFIDTAENYSNGLCEVAISKFIRKNRKQVIIASKFSPENCSFSNVIKSCNRSLIRLKTDYIDLYQIHWPNPSVNMEETIGAMADLKKQGKVKEIGISNFSAFELKKYKYLIIKNKIVSLQSEYNLFERTAETDGIFEFCKKYNLLFIAYSPLDQGRIQSLNKNQFKLLNFLSRKYNKTYGQIILRWVTNRGFVAAIVKTSKATHLMENANSMEFKIELSDIKKIDKTFFIKKEFIDTKKISVITGGERSRAVYSNIKEAILNKYQYIPSPVDLAKDLEEGTFLRPVRLTKVKGSDSYLLINGRIRYWAWVIAFGVNKPIPAYVRKHL